MGDRVLEIVEKVEDQLSQVIVYLGAIDQISNTWRSSPDLRGDAFIFRTVYEALWDGLIIRFGTIWDRTKGVASLPQLAVALKRLKTPATISAAEGINAVASAELRIISAWRNQVVAHRRATLNASGFDLENPLRHSDVFREAERVEALLAVASQSIDRSIPYFNILKDDASKNAKQSLERWRHVA